MSQLQLAACSDVFLIQPVKRNDIRVKSFHVGFVYRLAASHGGCHIFNELSRGISKRGGAVEYRRHKGIFGVGKKQLGSFCFYGIMRIVIFPATGQIVLIVGRRLRL